ncbi:MAG TPA: phosphomethylpyrimidine kinase [Dehalococcoidia bacterium]|jgi:hydroxymethylpyrimidine/phosphomethylpyrimidine kinase|nr:phosphomethylpyrimidine kinase [Dehalococcoidia bacterium]
MNRRQEIDLVLGNLAAAVAQLEACPEFAALIPEVRVNLVYAPRQATTPKEVAAIEGRITVVQGMPHASGMPALGVSDHLARRIIEVRKYAPEINAALNFKCDEVVIEVVQEYCSQRGLLFGWLDRSDEPAEMAERDGSSMPWKVKQLVTKYGAVPRLFYEGAGWGKEPLFLALGNDAVEVATMAIEIARRYQARTSG